MKRIASYEEYKKITDKYRKKSDFHNVYFLKSQVQELLAQEKLSFIEAGGNLYLFENCEGFSRFYYYIDKRSKADKIPYKETLVVEFVYNDPVTEKQTESIEYLKKLGFELRRQSIRMSLQNIDSFTFCEDACNTDSIHVRYAMDEEATEIRKLLLNSFDARYAFIPMPEEMNRIINDKRVLVAICKEHIVGLEHFEINNRVLQCWHMLVIPEYQGKGIGRTLFSESHRCAIGMADSGQVWLRANNIPAARLYHSGGYEEDGRRSDEYVYLADEK